MVENSVVTASGEIDWSEVNSYNQAMDLMPEVVSAGHVLGDGFAILRDKGMAIGREFLIIDWEFHTGDNGEFVSIRIINPGGEKARINDGSTGIYAQLKQLTERGITRGIHCPNGLRVSEYQTEDGKTARTYYIAS